jgi:iron complex outermembrane receptor protein
MRKRICTEGLLAGSLFISLIFSSMHSGPVNAGEALIEEIIVTAQKREQALQDTPISVTAFTGRAIEDLGFRQSVDITAQTPNFNVGYPNGDTGVPAMFIRGVGLNDFAVLNQGPIASYVDEVYVASNAAQIFQLLDVERVEVLRGPQGTLYGRNANGGAVNYYSRRPGEEWNGWGRAVVGEWSSTKFEGAIGGPVTDALGIRLAALKTDSDGWMKNRFTGNRQQGVDELAWRVLFDFAPNDSFDALVNIHGGETKSDSVQYRHLGTWPELFWFDENCSDSEILALECVDVVGYTEQEDFTNIFTGEESQAVPGYTEGNYDFESENDTSFWGVSLNLNWDIGNDITLTSITAYDDVDDSRPEETDAGPADVLTGVLGVEQETFSQEFRISQQKHGWNWLAGLYYLDDQADDKTSFDILRLRRPEFIGTDGGPDVCGPLVPDDNPSGFCPNEFVFEQISATEQSVKSFAIYGDASFDIAERWRLSASSDEKTSFDNISGRAVIDWRATEDLLLYGGISTGFKAGGIQSTTDGSFPFDEEELVSYEAGFKWTTAGGTMRFNGALFFYDYTDMQVFQFVIVGDPPTPISLLTNASDAETVGAEFEMQWLPVENLFINLGLGLLDAEYKDFIDDVGNDFSGNKITLAPDLSFNGLAQYDIPVDFGRFTLQLDWTYQDKVYFDSLNNELLSEDSYWIWNGRIAWTSVNEQWEIAGWGRNLGNEKYLSYAFDLSFFGFHEQMLGSPRMYGLEVTYRR